MSEETTHAVSTGVADGADEQELVTCVVDNVEFGLDIRAVQEIVRLPKITPVPNSPAYVKGVSNLRGNVLPIIDSRARFGMPTTEHEESSRVMVVELNGTPTGLIVDAVREVMHVKRKDIEQAPPVVHGVDSRFLSGIVKLDDGKRLVMLLAHNQLTDLQDRTAVGGNQVSRGPQVEQVHASAAKTKEDENEQLVTFRLADEEYGISIMDVQEIIRVPKITSVPNAPTGVIGVTSLRKQVLPAVELRTKFGFCTLYDHTQAFCERLRAAEQSHDQWAHQLQEAATAGTAFSGAVAAMDCEFGRWCETYPTTDKVVAGLLAPFGEAHRKLHDSALDVLAAIQRRDTTGALAAYKRVVEPLNQALKAIFKKALSGITRRDDERCVVVSLGDASVALRVDAVNEVLQVPKSAVEATPKIVSGQGATREQIRGVAKLEDGKRLIMMLNVSKLVDQPDLQALTTAAEQANIGGSGTGGMSGMNTAKDGDERQLVSFKVANEEFAMDIMQVQEIIRLEKVTKVPHAASFVEGLVNLRGNVLPVIDLRRRFNMAGREYDDSTRVVVVDIGGRKTGIIVDAVSEVLRLSRGDVEPAPGIVKAGAREDFIEGVGKLDDGKRMLLLLRADKLLSDEEMASLAEVMNEPALA
jgi:chemotaxis signal transduction protein